MLFRSLVSGAGLQIPPGNYWVRITGAVQTGVCETALARVDPDGQIALDWPLGLGRRLAVDVAWLERASCSGSLQQKPFAARLIATPALG